MVQYAVLAANSFPSTTSPSSNKKMFAKKEKSLAEIRPVFATKTARPVIPPKVKLLLNLKKYIPTAMRRVLSVSSVKYFIFSFMVFSLKK